MFNYKETKMVFIVKKVLYNARAKMINIICQIVFRLRSINKKNIQKVFIYTDSRGFLMNEFFCKNTPISSYVYMLSYNYFVKYQICKHKYTTIIDFLMFASKYDLSKFDKVILHLGIVDFSPRPEKQKEDIYINKKNLAETLTKNKTSMKTNDYDIEYENQSTFSLYDLNFLNEFILPQIKELSKKVNIIWLGINKVDINWNGNYFKKRPSNINIALEYQENIKSYISKNCKNRITYVDINEMENFNLKTHTMDNIHFTKAGFKFLADYLDKILVKN